MKTINTIILVCVIFLTGCVTTEVSTQFNDNITAEGNTPVATIFAENYGYYLFGYLPICAGNPDKPNVNTMSLFEDTVTIENNSKMINLEAQKLGATSLAEIRHSTNWTGGFSLWIIWKQVLTSNAFAVKSQNQNAQ